MVHFFKHKRFIYIKSIGKLHNPHKSNCLSQFMQLCSSDARFNSDSKFQSFSIAFCQEKLPLLQILTIVLSHVGFFRQTTEKTPIQICEGPDRPTPWRRVHPIEVRDDECLCGEVRAQTHCDVFKLNQSAFVQLEAYFLNETDLTKYNKEKNLRRALHGSCVPTACPWGKQ